MVILFVSAVFFSRISSAASFFAFWEDVLLRGWKLFIWSFLSRVGMKAWYCSLPVIVIAWSNRPFRISVAEVWLLLLLKKISVSLQLPFAHWNTARWVSMWFFVEHCKREWGASLFIFTPMPSHASLPWDVPRKCHSAGIPKSSS